MDGHQTALQSLCCICGYGAIKKKRKKKKWKQLRQKTMRRELLYGVDITKDNEDIHPKLLCYPCYYKIMDCRKESRRTSVEQYVKNRECFNVHCGPFHGPLSIHDLCSSSRSEALWYPPATEQYPPLVPHMIIPANPTGLRGSLPLLNGFYRLPHSKVYPTFYSGRFIFCIIPCNKWFKNIQIIQLNHSLRIMNRKY